MKKRVTALCSMPMALKISHGKPTSRSLRWGYTTGTCAAAAAKAALMRLFAGRKVDIVNVRAPGGRTLEIPVDSLDVIGEGAIATVIKDGGDDPDCTNGAEIIAQVSLKEGAKCPLTIRGGRGVGRVTRPGLAIAPGEWAINPIPRKMIAWAVEDALKETSRHLANEIGLDVEIIVPKGEELASQTLNPRLGIVGGISILGTTGLVKPFSHGAYRATIFTALRAARANGVDQVFLVTGSESDRFARALNSSQPEIAFCQMADYVKFSMEVVARLGFSSVHIYSFFGKAMKMAQGLRETHVSKGSVDLDFLALLATKKQCSNTIAMEISKANTARHALEIIKRYGCMELVSSIGELALYNLKLYTKKNIYVIFTILDFDGKILWQGD